MSGKRRSLPIGHSTELGTFHGELPSVHNRLHPSAPHMPVPQAECPACPANQYPWAGCPYCESKPEGAVRATVMTCTHCGTEWERVQLTLFPTRQGYVDLGPKVDWVVRKRGGPVILGGQLP